MKLYGVTVFAVMPGEGDRTLATVYTRMAHEAMVTLAQAMGAICINNVGYGACHKIEGEMSFLDRDEVLDYVWGTS